MTVNAIIEEQVQVERSAKGPNKINETSTEKQVIEKSVIGTVKWFNVMNGKHSIVTKMNNRDAAIHVVMGTSKR